MRIMLDLSQNFGFGFMGLVAYGWTGASNLFSVSIRILILVCVSKCPLRYFLSLFRRCQFLAFEEGLAFSHRGK